jgi:tRNA(Ile)-lysidine synthetase-like protein
VNQVHTLDTTAATRFLRDFRAIAGDGKKRVGLAVSGGPDSLALLLLAAETLDHVEAATVDHGLRPEGASEARYVSGIAKALAVRHSILKLPPKPAGNTSAWARKQRYQVLEKWADALELDLILTAHHADDQLETMLMRLNRGAGVGGMAGIRTLRGRIARPLMTWRKAELVALLDAQGIEAVDDPSNHDDRYDRARLRRSLDRSGVEDVTITGRCADFPLPEMVRTLSLAAATARVLVASEGAEGEVQVLEGAVVGVRAVREPAPGERKAASEAGEAAMALLQALEGGGYEVRFGQGAGEPLTLAVPRRARRR